MSSYNKSIFPLSDTSDNDLRSLCKTLWQWKLCEGCESQTECLSPCPWKQSERLETFFQYYRDTTAVFVPDCIGGVPTLQSHSDLLAIIRDIKQRPQLQRQTITQLHFTQKASSRGHTTLPSKNEQNQAVNLAVRIMAMVNSSTEDQVEGALLESGSMPVTWHGDTSFAEFMEQAFHTQDTTLQVTSSGDLFNQSTKLAKLTAKRLKRVAGLQLIPTDNLQNHLRLDVRRNTVEVYHHVAVLKEHLLAGMNSDSHEMTAQSIAQGNIPRDLALETLVTLQEILFPLDSDSQSLLRALVSKQGYDPECLRVDIREYRRAEEKTVQLRYWSTRLEDLYEYMQNPTPSGYIEKWMERRSGARYVMMATLGGVIFAVILGMLSLAVSIFQAWVGYQQWQHPINPS